MPESESVLLDLNNPFFQEGLFHLPKDDINRIFGTFRKLKPLTWAQVYRDKGLRWELVH